MTNVNNFGAHVGATCGNLDHLGSKNRPVVRIFGDRLAANTLHLQMGNLSCVRFSNPPTLSGSGVSFNSWFSPKSHPKNDQQTLGKRSSHFQITSVCHFRPINSPKPKKNPALKRDGKVRPRDLRTPWMWSGHRICWMSFYHILQLLLFLHSTRSTTNTVMPRKKHLFFVIWSIFMNFRPWPILFKDVLTQCLCTVDGIHRRLLWSTSPVNVNSTAIFLEWIWCLCHAWNHVQTWRDCIHDSSMSTRLYITKKKKNAMDSQVGQISLTFWTSVCLVGSESHKLLTSINTWRSLKNNVFIADRHVCFPKGQSECVQISKEATWNATSSGHALPQCSIPK